MSHIAESLRNTEPSSASERLIGIDLARSLALLGMCVVHFLLVAGAMQPESNERFSGRPAAVFVLLAGVGVSLFAQRVVDSGDAAGMRRLRSTLRKRGLVLLVLGFLNLVCWSGDILRVYGVTLIAAAGLIGLRPRWSLLAAGGCVVTFLVLLTQLDFEENWDWSTLHYEHLWTVAGSLRNLFYDGFRSVFPWAAFLLFGMAVGRLDLTQRRLQWRLLVGGLLVCFVVELGSVLAIRYFATHAGTRLTAEEISAVLGTGSLPPLPLFLLSAGGSACAVLGGCLLLPVNGLVRSLAAPGRYALSWYLLHIYVGLGGVIVCGFAQACPLWVAVGLGVGFWLAAVIGSVIYSRYYRVGPAETILRRLAGA